MHVGDTEFGQVVEFLQNFAHGEHHAIAHNAHDTVAHDAAGNHVQRVALAVDDEGVARVVPALEAHNGVHAVGQVVNNLAFAFIAPLGAYHYDVLVHTMLHFLRVNGSNGFAVNAQQRTLFQWRERCSQHEQIAQHVGIVVFRIQ